MIADVNAVANENAPPQSVVEISPERSSPIKQSQASFKHGSI